MYGWIWRHLPFGLPGKLIGSIGLIAACTALLWYVVFPWAEPLLPFDDVQVTQEDGGGEPGVPQEPAGPGPATPTPSLGEHDLPYATHTNNPEPSRTTGR